MKLVSSSSTLPKREPVRLASTSNQKNSLRMLKTLLIHSKADDSEKGLANSFQEGRKRPDLSKNEGTPGFFAQKSEILLQKHDFSNERHGLCNISGEITRKDHKIKPFYEENREKADISNEKRPVYWKNKGLSNEKMNISGFLAQKSENFVKSPDLSKEKSKNAAFFSQKTDISNKNNDSSSKNNDFSNEKRRFQAKKADFSKERSLIFSKKPELSRKNDDFPSQNVSISLENVTVPNKSQIISNLQQLKDQKLMKNQLDLSPFLEKMRVFHEEMEKNSSVSVMSYLSDVFSMLQGFSGENAQLSELFLMINKLFSLPVQRILEQFLSLRAFCQEKIDISKENNDFFEEKRRLLELERTQRKEIQKLRGLLENKGELNMEKETVLIENAKLKAVIKKQRKELCQQRGKDEKIMRLLNAIRVKGINLEEIYRETIVSSSESEGENKPKLEEPIEIIKGKPPDPNVNCFSFRKETLI